MSPDTMGQKSSDSITNCTNPVSKMWALVSPLAQLGQSLWSRLPLQVPCWILVLYHKREKRCQNNFSFIIEERNVAFASFQSHSKVMCWEMKEPVFRDRPPRRFADLLTGTCCCQVKVWIQVPAQATEFFISDWENQWIALHLNS